MPLMARAFHLLECEVNRVEETRAAPRLQGLGLLLQLIDVRSEGALHFRPIIKVNQKEFIVRVGFTQKLADRLTRRFHLVGHTPAGIKQQTDRSWNILAREREDFLFGVILE